ncbi:MAG: ABC transporter permease [Microscillaceae bacterium]|nr:ABC transporter permease [Microscillaceae bacterium]
MAKIIIDADRRASCWPNLREVYQHRELLGALMYRDWRVRYAQTALGLAWILAQPLTTVLVFALVFRAAFQIDTGLVPYPLFAGAGIVGWQYFAQATQQAGASLLQAQAVIHKIYFPRLMLPLSKVGGGLLDFALSLAFLLAFCLAFQVEPSWLWLLIPLWVLGLAFLSLGFGLWLSALSVRLRDMQPLASFALQMGIYLSPVAYPSRLIPEVWHGLYFCNPMAGWLETWRGIVLGTPWPPLAWLSLLSGLLILLSGLWFFGRTERVMADLL